MKFYRYKHFNVDQSDALNNYFSQKLADMRESHYQTFGLDEDEVFETKPKFSDNNSSGLKANRIVSGNSLDNVHVCKHIVFGDEELATFYHTDSMLFPSIYNII